MAREGTRKIDILPDETALYRAGAERFVALAAEAIAARGAFHVALAGGSTPKGLYALLATAEFAPRLDWSRVHLYFGDERMVPPQHEQSNYRMVRESLLDHLATAPAAVHRIAGELEPQQAAAAYADELAHSLPQHGFDLVLLGMGPDGHVASLFPGTDALARRKPAAVAVYVPKLESWRITLTLPAINHAGHVLVLVSGTRKSDVVRHVLRNISHAMPLPVELLRPRGTMEWLLDDAAATHLDRRTDN